MRDRGLLDVLPKREQARLLEELARLEKYLGGIKTMSALPSTVYIVDTRKEHIAIMEARKLGIPGVAIIDTNCDPDEVDHPIPRNDDAIRAVRLIPSRVPNAALEGLEERRKREVVEAGPAAAEVETGEEEHTPEGGERALDEAAEVLGEIAQTVPAGDLEEVER